MAGHNIPRQKFRRFAIAVFLLLAVGLSRQLLSKSRPSIPSVAKHERSRIHIEGRWEAVRLSLGLPPLPNTIDRRLITLPQSQKIAARFDLRRKRAEASLYNPPKLHLVSDAEDAPTVSTEALAASFHQIALAEKELAGVQARLRREKQEQGTQMPSRS
ncbi:hypothetical protein BV22DRAFT_1032194 [Leucogyrophana mollusca]|uniref:Uncharacterized protein n=1 Tax=Leucogyrophana mollusca TaxID=85980 RepID=A0ACB8BNB6_9AGAM|nr:hypothetical protein BV22DRAFT_1032194 [Leucogyrophana mollusca]